MEKRSLRNLIRQRKKQHSSGELSRMSADIVKKLLRDKHLQEAGTVLAYYSLPDEVDTHALVDILVADNKRVVLPVINASDEIELREYTSPEDMREGCFHIMEPVGRLFTDTGRIDVALVPGMSFDSRGNRLGRGKGYYDRFLSTLPSTLYKIGVCFDFQKVDAVPHESHDIPMDTVI